MKDPLGVSPSKGNQGTTRGKEKNCFDLGGSNPEVVGSIPTEIKRIFSLPRVGISWASHITLIYTSELIPCSTICVHSTRANAQWVFHGLHIALYLHFRVNSLFHHSYFMLAV